MNHANQIKNLLEFTAIFLSGDLDLKLESTDYYKEKYDKYIGIAMKHSENKTDTYVEWSKIWGENKDVNSIMNYFLSLVTIYRKNHRENDADNKHWLTKIEPAELLDSFTKHIGNPDEINDERYSYVHPIVKRQIYDEYIKRNVRYFKFLRILKENNE